jgi:general secretion pathway protein C
MQQLLNRAPRLLASILVVAMAAATGWQLYQFWRSIQPPGPTASASRTLVEPVAESPVIELAAIDLFGVADSNGDVAVDTENLPETNLRLVLRGVGASGLKESGRRLASALVEGPDRQTDYYVIGSELPGDAALKAVYPDRIVIERQGNLENLYFPEEFETASFEAQDAEPSSPGSGQINPSLQSAGSQSGAGASDARKEEIRARLERLRERLRSNN